MTEENQTHQSAFSALRDLRETTLAQTNVSDRYPASVVGEYARREEPTTDLGIERAIRAHEDLRRIYSAAIRQVAQYSSIRAAAASGTRVTERKIGVYTLEVISEDNNFPWLIIRIPQGASPVKMMELRKPNGDGCRVDLGQPVAHVLQLPLDPGFPELSDVERLLGDPETEIHLL